MTKAQVLHIIEVKGRYLGDARIAANGDEKTLSSIGGYEMALQDIAEAVEEMEDAVLYCVKTDHDAYCGRCGLCITKKSRACYDMHYCSNCGAYFKRSESCDSIGVMMEKMYQEDVK